MSIDLLPDPPSRAVTDPDAWSAEMHAWLTAFVLSVPQFNELFAEANARVQQAFTGTSSDSITIGTGTKVISASEAMALVAGHKVVIAAALDPDNVMTATVTAYDPDTGSLTVDVTDTDGSGTYDDWTIGIAITADLSAYLPLAGGEMTGRLVLPSSGGGAPTFNLQPANANSALAERGDIIIAADGAMWISTAPGSMTQVVLPGNVANLSNKTYYNPALNGTPTTDIYAITDGASVAIDPADGEVQTWTLGANRTPTLTGITAGKAVLLMVDDGSAYTLTLSSVTWLTDDGDPPALKTSGFTSILLFNVGGTLYGWRCGDGG